MAYRSKLIFVHFLILLSIFSAVSSTPEKKSEPGVSPRMPMHKTDGIFDLVTMQDMIKLLQKVMQIPMQTLGRAVIPILELPYHILSTLWSWVGPGTTVPGMTPMGSRSLSTGLIAGIVSRIFNIDLVDMYFKGLEIQEDCRESAACEMGAYVAHQNKLAAPVLNLVFQKLFRSTTKYWKNIQLGILGAVCHNEYTSCKKQFVMRR